MGDSPRKAGVAKYRVQDRREPFRFEPPRPRPLVPEKAELCDETNVGEGDVVPYKELALRHQRAVDSREIRRQRIASSGLGLEGSGSADQRQQVRLRISREDQAGVEEAVHPRSFVGATAVQWKGTLTKARNGTHDAVRLEDPDLAIRTERGRDGAEWMGIHECVRFAKRDPLE